MTDQRSALSASLLVGRDLRAVAMTELLEVRGRLKLDRRILPFPEPVRSGPFVDDRAAFRPGVLFPDRADSSVAHYVPAYRLDERDGGPDVRLEYVGEDTLAGRLTIGAAWSVPGPADGGSVEPRTIQHVAALRLHVGVPVRAEPGAAMTGSVAEQIELQPLSPTGPSTAVSETLFASREEFQLVYAAMRDPAFAARLEVVITAEVGVRTWRQILVGRPTAADELTKLARGEGLVTKMLSTKSLDQLARPDALSAQAKVRISDDRPDPDADAVRIEAQRAIEVVRPHRGRVIESVVATRMRSDVAAGSLHSSPTSAIARLLVDAAARTGTVDRFGSRIAATHPTVTAVVSERALADAVTHVHAPTLNAAIATTDLKLADRAFVPVELVLDPSRQPAIVDVVLTTNVETPFTFPPAETPAVYSGDDGGLPAARFLLRRQVTDQRGRSHTFLQDNAMPDVVLLPPTGFRLERDSVPPFLPRVSFVLSDITTTDDEAEAEVLFRATMVYELEPWTDHAVVELVRAQLRREGVEPRFSSTSPKRAELRLADAVRPDAVIDPVSGIRDVYEMDYSEFNALLGETLSQPGGLAGHVVLELFDGTETTVDARLSFFGESADLVVPISVTSAKKLVVGLSRGARGDGVRRVQQAMLDHGVAVVGGADGTFGRRTEESLQSFQTTSGLPTSGQVDEPTASALGLSAVHVATLRNRIESPATIVSVPAVAVGADAKASPVDAGLVGRQLAPGEELVVDYRLSGESVDASTTSDAIDSVVFARADPNVHDLLGRLIVTSGYRSLAFGLAVAAADGTFGAAAAGTDPLTGLLVEFDDGSEAMLTPDAMATEVTLLDRVVDQIFGVEGERRYFYRVTNLHAGGPGARTGWVEGVGEEPLTVGAAVVELAF